MMLLPAHDLLLLLCPRMEQPGAQPAEPQQQEAATPSAATSKAQAVDAAGSSPAAKGSKPNGLPPVARQSSNLANKIAAFSSGVAPVRKGITNANEDAITVEDVLHKLETSGRVRCHCADVLHTNASAAQLRLHKHTACF